MKLIRSILPSLIATMGAVTVGLLPAELWLSPSAELTEKSTTIFTLPFTRIEVILRARAFFGLGIVCGALLAGVSLSLIGRRCSMALYDVLLTYGLVIHVVPHAAWWLAICSRLFLGIAVGALSAIIPIYVYEISQPKLKNKLGLLYPVFVTVGALCWRAIGLCAKYEGPLRLYVFGAFAQYVPFFVIFCSCWTTVHAIGSCLIPESPDCWLADTRDDDRVSYIELKQLLSDRGDAMKQMLSVKQIRSRWNPIYAPGIMSNKKNRNALLTGIGYMFFNQVCGMNVTILFMDHILQMAGSCVHLQTLRSSVSIDVIQVVMAIIAMTVIDKVGRQFLLIFSVLLMSVSAVGLVGCFVLITLKINIANAMDWLPLCLIGIYICAYSLGLGPMAWVVMCEIFSNEVRPYGMSITTAVHWMSIFLILYVRDDIFNVIEVDNFFIFIYVLCLILALFFQFFMPKTHVESQKFICF